MHFGLDESAHKQAALLDIDIVRKYFSQKLTYIKIRNFTEKLRGAPKTYSPLWCGKYSIPFGLLTMNKVINEIEGKKLTGKMFSYSNSWMEGVIPVKHTNLGITAPFSIEH